MRSFFHVLLVLPAVIAVPVLLENKHADTIANSWIVRVNADSILSDVVFQVTEAIGVEAARTFEVGDFKGFSINNVPDLLSLVANIASIESIEPNSIVRASALVTQNNVPSYGLARISHRRPGATSYIYDSSAGAGTFSYIIDTGIRRTHQDFQGRAFFGASFVPDEAPDNDFNGHGTHVAGTTGSATYGVAKRTTLIAVKVLNGAGSGQLDGVISGIAWAVNDAQQNRRIHKSIANLSLGSVYSPTTNAAVRAAVAQGLFLAVAAGNSNMPVSAASPASEHSVCTVGASDRRDMRAPYSNYGSGIDVFAPGSDITSTWIDEGDAGVKTISGTSMAAPHVAGLAAYLLGLEGNAAGGPKGLCARIRALAVRDALEGLLILSPNRLAYNGNGA